MKTGIPYHRFANAFPLVGGEEFERLCRRMSDHGYDEREPIVLLEGQILDGRNRQRVCEATGVEPVYRQFDPHTDGDPLEFVVRKNLDRRNMSTSQRAMAAAELGRLGWGGDRSKPSNDGLSVRERALRLKVGPSSVERAQLVVDLGDLSLQESVRQGETPVSTASEIARLPKERQREILQGIAANPVGRKALRQIAKQARAEDQAQRHVDRQRRLNQVAADNPELPGEGARRYSILLVDVPRKHNVYSDDSGSEKSPENHYPVMTFRELVDFPIDRFAAPSALIYYWSTAASLVDDLEILAEWGFVSLRPRDENGRLIRDANSDPLPPVGLGRYGSHQIWRKVRSGNQTGMGRWFRDEHELLIVARRRNSVPAPLPGTQDNSVFDAAWDSHSTKPGERIRAAIDRQYPEIKDKIELFARGEAPPGWAFWGNQAVTPDVEAAEPRADRQPQRPPLPSTAHDLEIPPFLRRQSDQGAAA